MAGMGSNHSSIYGSDERIPHGDSTRGYSALYAYIIIDRILAKKGLYIVSVNNGKAPQLEGKEGVLRQIDMGDEMDPESIDYLVNGSDAAKDVAELVHAQTGSPVGIAKYEGHSSLVHIEAQEALRAAETMNKPFHLYEETKDVRH